MKPQDTTACDIIEIRTEMEKILKDHQYGTFKGEPIFDTAENRYKYIDLQTELKKLVNNPKK